MLVAQPSPSTAGEVGARITKAVTTSELGIAVRRSVVQGAQIMDRLDQQAEQFSDRFQLGSERAQQQGRPKPKVIPPPKPLDTKFANAVLQITDRSFCKVARVPLQTLARTIQENSDMLRPSFERAGLDTRQILSDSGEEEKMSGDIFNFRSYVRYKSYLDLLASSPMEFPKFKASFEEEAAKQMVSLLLPDWTDLLPPNDDSATAQRKQEAMESTLQVMDQLLSRLVESGFIAQIDRSPIDQDDIIDWSEKLADVSWTIALDGDVTLPSQLLLQEQGYRFYPNYANILVSYTLRSGLTSRNIIVEDYYMDTDYNSDPNKFEVKEVLLNVNIES